MLLRLILCLFLAATASAHAQERQWNLDAGDEDAYLVFGVPDTDDVGVSLWCSVQTGEVNLFLPASDAEVTPGKSLMIKVAAGEEKIEIQGKCEANAETGSVSVEAKLKDSDPIFSGLLRADRFRVNFGGEERIFPLIDADVEGLLSLCRKP